MIVNKHQVSISKKTKRPPTHDESLLFTG